MHHRIKFDIIIIIIIINQLCAGICNYIPQTKHFSRVYTAAAAVYLHFTLHVTLIRLLNMLSILHQCCPQYACNVQWGCFFFVVP